MQIHSTPLSPDKHQSLSQWLDQPEFDTLIEVLESGRFDVQVEASGLREHDDETVAIAKAVILDNVAREIAKTIATLKALKQQKESFTISSATP